MKRKNRKQESEKKQLNMERIGRFWKIVKKLQEKGELKDKII